ncbi:MAG: hypothetical protein OXF26_00045, partial [Alphaproteobacteria bacterium]|nr:hypothetical protein [Alphaproteobacteria bacterium]
RRDPRRAILAAIQSLALDRQLEAGRVHFCSCRQTTCNVMFPYLSSVQWRSYGNGVLLGKLA